MYKKIKNLGIVLLLTTLFISFTSVTLTWAASETVNSPPSYSDVRALPLDEPSTIAAQQAITPEINDIVGATYDSTTGELIILGRMINDDRPTMHYYDVQEYLVTALRAMHNNAGDFPGVTIGTSPSPDPSYHLVEYFGNITDTRYGYGFFEADRLLKTYSLGRDNLNPSTPFTSSVPGYISYPDRLAALGASVPSARFFFTSSLHLQSSPVTSDAIIFNNTRVVLNYVIDSGETPQNRQAGEEFAAHFNANYDLFAAEQFERGNRTFYDLPQLFKLYGIAYWSWAADNAAINTNGVNAGWLANYPIITFDTPVTTPVTSQGGVQGGVVALFPKDTVENPLVDQIRQKLFQDRPNLQAIAWHSDTPGSFSCSACNSVRCLAMRISANIVQEGSFEEGPTTTSWVQNPAGGWDLILDFAARRGNYGVHLSRAFNTSGNIYQDVVIPATASNPRLTYYWYISTDEPLITLLDDDSPFVTEPDPEKLPMLPYFARQSLELPSSSAINSDANISTSVAKDFLYVQVLDSNNNVLETLQTASNEDASDSWELSSFSLDTYKGQTIRIRFLATNDSNNYTFFLIDDVSLDIDPPPVNIIPTEGPIYLPIIMK